MERIPIKGTKGQMRIVEVIIASFIIMFALSFANMLAVTPTSPKYEVTELEKMGYNVLFDLDKRGILANFVYNKQWNDLQAALRVLLPLDVYFNLTVCYLNGTEVNEIPIFYGNRETFTSSKNVASVTYCLCGYFNSTINNADYDPRILILQLVRG